MAGAALVAVSLAAGLAALASAARPAAAPAPRARLLVSLPDPVVAVAGVAAALATLAAVALALARDRRRRAPVGLPDVAMARVPAWLRPLLSVLALVPYLLLALAIWRAEAIFPGLFAHLRGQLGMSPGGLAPDLDGPVTSSPLYTAAVAGLVLLLSVGSLAVMLWVLVGDRVAVWWARAEPDPPAPAPLAIAVEDSLDDLRREPDARTAIIRCYRHFEGALGRAQVPRRAWLTPAEFMREALARLPLPVASVQRLTGLFELSRFSDEALGAAERQAALESLLDIRAHLAGDAARAAAD